MQPHEHFFALLLQSLLYTICVADRSGYIQYGEWLRCVIAEGFGKKPACLPQELSGFESLDFRFQGFYSSYYNRIVNKPSFNRNKTVKIKTSLVKRQTMKTKVM